MVEQTITAICTATNPAGHKTEIVSTQVINVHEPANVTGDLKVSSREFTIGDEVMCQLSYRNYGTEPALLHIEIDGEVVVDGYSLVPGPTFNLQWPKEAGFGAGTKAKVSLT